MLGGYGLMKRSMVLVMALVLTLAGCSRDSTESFGEGRDWVPVHYVRRIPYEDPRPVAESLMTEYAALLDVPGASEGMDFSVGMTTMAIGELEDGARFVFSYNSTRQWAFTSARGLDDQLCRECGVVPFGKEEAVRRTKEHWRAMGYDPDNDFVITAVYAFGEDGNDSDSPAPVDIAVYALYKFEGIATGLSWYFQYSDTDGHLTAINGYWGSEISVAGEAPLLTPAEALQLKGTAVSAVNPSVIEGAKLSATIYHQRPEGIWWLIPSYDFPIDDPDDPDSLGISFSAFAVRGQDLPDIPTDDPSIASNPD